jgi:glycosyltransferase involved in cell wall biosynthesis
MPIPLLERAMLGMMGRATLVATMGPTVRSLLVEQGLDEQRVVVIPPATDSARFARSPALAPRYAAVSVAALIERKRVHDLVEAAAALRERHPAARFAVAGSGPQLTALERRAAELGVADRIDFLGHVDRVEDVLGNALAFVLPSAAEGLPIGMLDAMAASLPIVATPVGEIPDVIRPGENGFLFDVGDVDALTGQLDALLSYPATARRLGEEARRDVVARYSIEAVSDIYSQLLR